MLAAGSGSAYGSTRVAVPPSPPAASVGDAGESAECSESDDAGLAGSSHGGGRSPGGVCSAKPPSALARQAQLPPAGAFHSAIGREAPLIPHCGADG